MARVIVDADYVGDTLRDCQGVALVARLPPLRETHKQRSREKAVHQNRSGGIDRSDGRHLLLDEGRVESPGVFDPQWIDGLMLDLPGHDALPTLIALDDPGDEVLRRRQQRRKGVRLDQPAFG